MPNDRRVVTTAVTTALIAGAVAAGVAYVMHIRPQWRRYVVDIGKHLLDVAEGMLRRPGLDSEVRERLDSAEDINPQMGEAFRDAIRKP